MDIILRMDGVASTSKYERNEDEKKISKYVKSEVPSKQNNREERKTFACSFCTLNEKYDYRGTKPPFQKHVIYLEECYVMKDPFTALNQREALVLGGDCYFCKKSVCLDCSIFYTKRFCKICALDNIQDLPLQLHKKIKQLASNENITQ